MLLLIINSQFTVKMQSIHELMLFDRECFYEDSGWSHKWIFNIRQRVET